MSTHIKTVGNFGNYNKGIDATLNLAKAKEAEARYNAKSNLQAEGLLINNSQDFEQQKNAFFSISKKHTEERVAKLIEEGINNGDNIVFSNGTQYHYPDRNSGQYHNSVLDTFTSLTYRIKDIIAQKVRTQDIEQFIPIVKDATPFSTEVQRMFTRDLGDANTVSNFKSTTGDNSNVRNDVDVEFQTSKFPTFKFVNSIKMDTITAMTIDQAVQNFSYDTQLIEATAKKYTKQLENMVLGYGVKGLDQSYGLGNLRDVGTDTSIITGALDTLTDTDFETAVGNLINAYISKSNNAVKPNVFVLSFSERIKLSNKDMVGKYPTLTRLEYLQKKLNESFGEKVEVLPNYHFDEVNLTAAFPGVKGKYLLYRKDPEILAIHEPNSFTITGFGTPNNYNYEAIAYAINTSVCSWNPDFILDVTRNA